MDFQLVSNHTMDETVDYRIWLRSRSYTARPPSSLLTYITGISGASSASPCWLLAAQTMNVGRRSGHVVPMHQAEHPQKCSLITRLTLSESFPSIRRSPDLRQDHRLSDQPGKNCRSTPGRKYRCETLIPACRLVVLCLLFQTGSSIHCCRNPPHAWGSWLQSAVTFDLRNVRVHDDILHKNTKKQRSQEVFVPDLPLEGGPAARAAGLKVIFKAAVDPNTKKFLSHLCSSTFLSMPVVTHVLALNICQLVQVPASAGAALECVRCAPAGLCVLR